MAMLAVCTHCSGELVLSASTAGAGLLTDQHLAAEQRIACPLCGEQFRVGQTTLRSLPEASLLADTPNLQISLESQANRRPQRPKQQNSRHLAAKGIRTLVIMVGIGTVLTGGLLGQYILLWIRGSEADFIHLAHYLPDAILPPSMHASTVTLSPSTPLASATLAVQKQDPPPLKDSITHPPAASIAPSTLPKSNRQAQTNGNAATEKTDPPPKADPPTQMAAAQQTPVRPPQPIETHLRDAPRVELHELTAALKAAEQAQADLLSGDLSRRETIIRKGRSFITLCDLAAKLTFIDRGVPQVLTQLLLTKELFRDTMQQPTTRAELARIADRWLDHPNRSTPGLFCAGRIVDVKTSGPWVLYRLALGASEELAAPAGARSRSQTGEAGTSKSVAKQSRKIREVIVVTNKRRYGLGKRIGLVGVIVDPRQLDPSLTGDPPAVPPPVVYTRFLYDLDRTRQSPGNPTGKTPKSVLSSLGLQ